MSSESLELERIGELVRAAVNAADLAAFTGLLAPDVRWGQGESSDADCRSRSEVVDWWSRGREAGVRATITEVMAGAGTLLVGLRVTGTPDAERDGGETQRWQVLSVKSGQIVDIRGFDDRRAAALRAGTTGGSTKVRLPRTPR